jgi:hypothetical protein
MTQSNILFAHLFFLLNLPLLMGIDSVKPVDLKKKKNTHHATKDVSLRDHVIKCHKHSTRLFHFQYGIFYSNYYHSDNNNNNI